MVERRRPNPWSSKGGPLRLDQSQTKWVSPRTHLHVVHTYFFGGVQGRQDQPKQAVSTYHVFRHFECLHADVTQVADPEGVSLPPVLLDGVLADHDVTVCALGQRKVGALAVQSVGSVIAHGDVAFATQATWREA